MIVSNGSRTDDGDPYDRKLFRRNGVAFRDFSRGLVSCYNNTRGYTSLVSGQNATGQNATVQNATMSKTDKMPRCKWCNKDAAKVLQGCNKSVAGV